MTGSSTRRNPGLALLSGILIVADAGLAALGWLVWAQYQRGHLTGQETASFVLLGGSAVAGVVVYLLTVIAFARGPLGQRVAAIAAGLAWTRVLAVVVAVAGIAVAAGLPAVAGAFSVVGTVVAVGEALGALVVTGAARRRAIRV